MFFDSIFSNIWKEKKIKTLNKQNNYYNRKYTIETEL